MPLHEIFTTVKIAYYSWKVAPYLQKFYKSFTKDPEGWMDQINHNFTLKDKKDQRGKILCEIKDNPKLTSVAQENPLKLSFEVLEEAKRNLQLHEVGALKINDPHAIVVEQTNWNDIPLNIDYWATDYCVVAAMHKFDMKPKILSANAVLVCPETEQLVLHRRNPKSRTYGEDINGKSYIHTIGGAFMPSRKDLQTGDLSGLRITATREISEEIQIGLTVPENITCLFLDETWTGFIQYLILGIEIRDKQLNSIKDNWEGKHFLVKFDDLEKLYRSNEPWVPTARIAILAWLAKNAPGGGFNPKFSGKSAHEMFYNLVKC